MDEDKLIKKILKEQKVIAIVGLSPKEHRTSHTVSSYLKDAGYKIIPVYPREDEILGEKVYRQVSDIKEAIDTVVIFRRSDEVVPVVEDAIKVKPAYIWMQLGIENEDAKNLAEKHGSKVIMDRCMYREHVKL